MRGILRLKISKYVSILIPLIVLVLFVFFAYFLTVPSTNYGEKYENPHSRPQSPSFLALGKGIENPRNLGIVWACADKSLLCVFPCINFVTKCPSCLVGGGALVHRDVLYMELCHCPVRVMGRDSYNFAILRGVTNTAFMPARQREMARGYVGYGCFTLSLSRVHWQNQNFINKEVQISFRPILRTKWYHALRLKSKDLILWIHNWLWEWKGFF